MESGVASHSRQDALDALLWLTGAGIDTVVSDQPRVWLQPASAPAQEAPFSAEIPENIPESNVSSTPRIDASPGPLLVEGLPGAVIALVIDADPRTSGKTILAAAEALLLSRMVGAIGLHVDEVIRLGLPARQTGEPQQEQIAAHGATALLLLGDGPARALLGKPVAKARGEVHSFDLGGKQVSAVVTLAPHFLIQQPRMKALAWDDLRLFARLVRQ